MSQFCHFASYGICENFAIQGQAWCLSCKDKCLEEAPWDIDFNVVSGWFD